jgi:hypothetical protein
MAHEQELTRLQSVRAGEKERNERWPVPYAAMFIIVVSVALWSLIVAVASWLLG